MRRLITFITAGLLAAPVFADISVEFKEGAPKDRFFVSNVGTCDQSDLMLTIDFSDSAGALIFDTTASGAGVEVFQPFEVVSGADVLASLPTVTDGQTQVTLELASFPAGETLVLSTDLDDTIGAREITVRGSEFAGTSLSLSGRATGEAVFTETPVATITLEDC